MNQPYYEPRHPSVPGDAAGPDSGIPKLISAEYLLKLGNRHYNNYQARGLKRDLETAIDHYRNAMEMDPTLPEVYVKLASTLWEKGAIPLEVAIDYCESGLQFNPDYSDGHLFLGYFLRRAGHLAEAEAHFRTAIETIGSASPAKARMALGRVMIQKATLSYELPAMSRLAMAGRGIQEFSAGCLLLPSDQNAFHVLQGAFVADLQIFGITGAGWLLKLLGFGKATISLYEWAARCLPQEPVFFHLLGDLHFGKKNHDGAIYCYNRAQELDPDNPLLYKKLGRLYNRCNDTLNAAKSLEKVVEAEAQDFDTLYMLAQIYLDRGEYMRALYYYKELLGDVPDNPYIHSNMAYVLFKLEDYDGAIVSYQSAVNFGQDPVWTATVAQTLGTIYYQIKNDMEAAISMFQLAYQLDSGNPDCLSMLGDIYTEQGNFEAAIQAYRYILSVEPDNADCYNYLGYLLWQLDKNDEAVDAYQKAIDLYPRNPIAFNNLGVIYLDEKCQLHKALEMFESACQLNPDYTLACFNVARTKEALGLTAEAAKGYTEALALNRQHPEITDEEIQERLDNLFQV
ncbi:MAG TPA: tetratricopeptide repeat protein [Coleofasciculaceae cyanobacterium]|jgi:tetratricopeptide (TPR) repeat protein